MNTFLIVASFFTGILTFFTSCAFILVPPFLGLVGISHIEQEAREKKDIRFKILKNTIFYILGFSLIFTLMGLGVGFVGRILIIQDWISRAGGVILLFFGLFMIGFFRYGFFIKNIAIKPPKFLLAKGKFNSFLLGGIFAFGWSPCTGPFLGSILVMAGYSGTMIKGALLLFIFSLGLALPFILAALFWGQMNTFFGKSEKFLKGMSFVSGAFLILIGALLISGKFYTAINFLF